ncbi:MAG: tyrosine-type recombinase/integrase [Methylovulum sp.]|nr:tyrosine-type recombinase/integrase [Methylovulum sp.]
MVKPRKNAEHNKLPKYVYIRRGFYIYRPHLGNGKLGKDIKLCPVTAPLSELHKHYESLTCTNAPRKTLDWLFGQYLTSKQHAAKSVKTRAEYEKNAKTLRNTTTKSGTLFGQIDVERITPGTIRKYIDARDKPVSANREVAFMSVCFSWAVERDLLKSNPCKEVRRNSEKPRTRYVTDEEYQRLYAMAAKYPHVQCAMEFAYLCRMRLCEVLDLKKSDIGTSGLHIRRRKGSRDNITTWTPRLEAVIKHCTSLPTTHADIENPHLIRGQTGDKLTESGFQTLWQRLMVNAAENGLERFTFHDLKAKGVSDTEGNKQEASGHRTAAMVDTYNRKLSEVKPAGGG